MKYKKHKTIQCARLIICIMLEPFVVMFISKPLPVNFPSGPNFWFRFHPEKATKYCLLYISQRKCLKCHSLCSSISLVLYWVAISFIASTTLQPLPLETPHWLLLHWTSLDWIRLHWINKCKYWTASSLA